jgi:phage baseplate assembly protein W
MVRRGEWAFKGFGSEINDSLFNPIDDDFLEDIIIDETEQILQQLEPRINNISVTVDNNLELNAIGVDINFSILNSEETFFVEVILERIR